MPSRSIIIPKNRKPFVITAVREGRTGIRRKNYLVAEENESKAIIALTRAGRGIKRGDIVASAPGNSETIKKAQKIPGLSSNNYVVGVKKIMIRNGSKIPVTKEFGVQARTGVEARNAVKSALKAPDRAVGRARAFTP